MKLGADWLFTCDSDQTIPVEAFAYFMDWANGRIKPEADIYVIDAPNKGQDDSNVRCHPDGTLAYFTISCCLISRKVFEILGKSWFSSEYAFIEDGIKNGKIVWNVQKKYADDNINEDIYFARKCLEAGLKVVVIPDVKSKHLEI